MEGGLSVRRMGRADRALWAAMYAELFPTAGTDACLAEIDRILDTPGRAGFVAERGDTALGFAETSIRPFANGCDSQPVPFLEGIWVRAASRRKGIAAALLVHVEAQMRAAGFTELGSDVDQGNGAGQAFHGASGFQETERVIYFRKPL